MRENVPLISVRGIAALWVVGYHLLDLHDTPPMLPGVFQYGFTAVDLFFILSGFILMTAHPGLCPAVARPFFVKRAARVLPLHWTVMMGLAGIVLAASALHLPFNADGHYNWSMFLPALFLFKEFVPGPGNWNGPAWSLAVEAICYILMPLFAPIVARADRRSLLISAAVLTAAMCGYMGAMLRAYSPHYGDFWLSPLGVVRGLLAFPLGCVLARLMAGSVDSIRPHAGRLEALSLASMVAASVAGRPELILPGCAGLIVALSLDAGPAARLLRGRPWHWLGQVSFSVYLVHLPVLLLMGKIMTPAHMPIPLSLVAPLRAAVALTIVLTLSAATYRWIETPGRAIPRRWAALKPDRLPLTIKLPDVIRSGRRALTFAKLH